MERRIRKPRQSMGLPQPVDKDWQQIQEQIDAVVHELDPPEADDVSTPTPAPAAATP